MILTRHYRPRPERQGDMMPGAVPDAGSFVSSANPKEQGYLYNTTGVALLAVLKPRSN